VPKPNPQGRKTHGEWLDAQGRPHHVVSGKDKDSLQVWRLMREAGIRSAAEPVTTTHVEMKVVARMVREHRKEVEVVLNNKPCQGRFGCDRLIPMLLPEGYALTIHGPNYRKTFTGGARPR
jgi:hypothetical protein